MKLLHTGGRAHRIRSLLRSVTSRPPWLDVVMICPASSSILIRCTMSVHSGDVDLCSTITDGPFPFQLRCVWKRLRPETLSARSYMDGSFRSEAYSNLSKSSHLPEPSVNTKSQVHSRPLLGVGYTRGDTLHCGRSCSRANCKIRSKICILRVIDSGKR